MLKRKDKRGHETQYAYDAMNRLTQTTNSDGSVMKTEYDTLGNKTSETDRRGKTTTYGYDVKRITLGSKGKQKGITSNDSRKK